jgi:putative transposase
MPRRQRLSTCGVIFHALNRAAKRAPLFEDFGDYAALLSILADGLRRYRVVLFAYCLMPTHWHFVLSPLADGELSRFMHWFTTTHARRWQIAHGMNGYGAVYQGRFKAVPVGHDRFLWVCRYVERNPVRASLVDSADQWYWSSLSQRLRGSDCVPLLEWPVVRPDDWLAQVNAAQTPAEIEAFHRSMKHGKPFGTTPDPITDMLPTAVLQPPLHR